MKIHLDRQKDREIELLDIDLPKLKEEPKPEKKRLVFWWNKKKKKSFLNQKNEQIEVLDIDEPIKNEENKKKTKLLNKIKLPRIKNKVKFASACFGTLVIFILALSLITGKNIVSISAKKFLNGLGIYTEEVKKVEIQSNDYDSQGSWHIDKSAKWTGTNTAQVTFDVNSIMKTGDHYKDIVLVLDISGSMSGDKIAKAISDSKELVSYLLSNNQNRIAIVTFDSTSTIISNFSNDKDDLLTKLDAITTTGCTNYNAALQNVDIVMNGYTKQSNRDVVTLFLTDGYPNEDIPNQVGTFEVLKDKYPYMTVNGVQYEMGIDIIDEIKQITDSQWVADQSTLNNVLFDASISPIVYEEFIVTDYVDDDYFTISSVNDIKVSTGTVTLEEESGLQKITWNLGSNAYMTGGNAKMTINLTLKQQYVGSEGYYPTNKKEKVEYKLPEDTEKTVNSTNTPVLKNNYDVIYDTNTPSNCTLPDIASEKHFIYQNVTKKDTELSCEGYLFKGWEIDEDDAKDITKVNDDVFVMPEHDVTIRATWTRQSIVKTMDGTVHEKTTLYKVLQNEAATGTYAKEYTGNHQDSMDASKSTQKIYYYYGSNATNGTAILDKNNVLFAGQCWQMIRTTDTGGVKMIYNGEAVDNQCLSTRGTHVGYASRTRQNLASNYWYGTDYTYDSVSKKFKVSGTTEQTVWNESNGPGLIGKYTCKLTSEDGSCSTLYLVESYYNTSSAYVIPLKSNSHYSQFGTLQFNASYNSPTYVGYMYGDVYEYSSTGTTLGQRFETTQTMLQLTSLETSYWYADSIDYGTLTANRYSLINPYQVSATTDYPNLVGKYTFRSSSGTNTATDVYYIAAVNNTTMYYKQLQSGNLLSAYEPIVFGDSIRDNGDGTYTINNPTNVTLSDWYTNYANYKEKYTCNDSSTTCASPRYTTATTSTYYEYINAGEKIMIGKTRSGLTLTDTLLVRKDELVINSSNYSDYKYTCNTDSATCTEATLRMISGYSTTGYNYAPNHYYGSSVTWDGTNYTLVDPIEIENYNNLNNISTHHYMCVSNGLKTCATVAYVYHYTGSGAMYYITLRDGITSVDKALGDMLTKNTTNSIMKSGIDAWYKHYLLEDYDDYIEDTIFCNDRSIRALNGWNPDGGMTNDILQFKEYNVTSDLSCTNTTDKFSVSNNNAKLTYKVGLMSSPEMNLLNNSIAQKTGEYYWLASPYCFDGSFAIGRVVNTYGNMYNYVVSPALGVRPAVSLTPGIEYSDGDGSMANPYKVELGS